MKAAVLHELGGIPRYENFPDPVAGDGEVVVEVKAAGINPAGPTEPCTFLIISTAPLTRNAKDVRDQDSVVRSA